MGDHESEGREVRKSFTSIEVVVVIVIIAILAVIVAPSTIKAIEEVRVAASVKDYHLIKTGAMSYYKDTGEWPVQDTDGVCEDFLSNESLPAGTESWNGPYLKQWPPAAKWGGAYHWCVVSAVGNGFCEAWDNDLTQERYVQITQVPQAAAQNIDTELDGSADGGSGSVRYDAGVETTVRILVSED